MPSLRGRSPLKAFDHAVVALFHEVMKFGTVGVINFFVDVGLFNLLRVELMPHRPLTCKFISSSVAAISSYFMNRHWTWRHRARSGMARELPLFLILTAVGVGITLACLAVSHYVLGLHSVLADNISANFVGLAIAMAWRFWSYKRWVFLEDDPNRDEEAAEAAVRTTV
ncbi:MAG: GtrA family protein [Actinomycetes bacterium]